MHNFPYQILRTVIMSDNDDDYDTISRLLPSGCQAMHVCVYWIISILGSFTDVLCFLAPIIETVSIHMFPCHSGGFQSFAINVICPPSCLPFGRWYGTVWHVVRLTPKDCCSCLHLDFHLQLDLPSSAMDYSFLKDHLLRIHCLILWQKISFTSCVDLQNPFIPLLVDS